VRVLVRDACTSLRSPSPTPRLPRETGIAPQVLATNRRVSREVVRSRGFALGTGSESGRAPRERCLRSTAADIASARFREDERSGRRARSFKIAHPRRARRSERCSRRGTSGSVFEQSLSRRGALVTHSAGGVLRQKFRGTAFTDAASGPRSRCCADPRCRWLRPGAHAGDRPARSSTSVSSERVPANRPASTSTTGRALSFAGVRTTSWRSSAPCSS
jgi:hypothetical protein